MAQPSGTASVSIWCTHSRELVGLFNNFHAISCKYIRARLSSSSASTHYELRASSDCCVNTFKAASREDLQFAFPFLLMLPSLS